MRFTNQELVHNLPLQRFQQIPYAIRDPDGANI